MFFGRHLLSCVAFEIFCMLKISFLIYIKKKSIVTLNLKCIIVRKQLARKYQQICVKKNLEMMANVFFISVNKNNLNILPK